MWYFCRCWAPFIFLLAASAEEVQVAPPLGGVAFISIAQDVAIQDMIVNRQGLWSPGRRIVSEVCNNILASTLDGMAKAWLSSPPGPGVIAVSGVDAYAGAVPVPAQPDPNTDPPPPPLSPDEIAAINVAADRAKLINQVLNAGEEVRAINLAYISGQCLQRGLPSLAVNGGTGDAFKGIATMKLVSDGWWSKDLDHIRDIPNPTIRSMITWHSSATVPYERKMQGIIDSLNSECDFWRSERTKLQAAVQASGGMRAGALYGLAGCGDWQTHGPQFWPSWSIYAVNTMPTLLDAILKGVNAPSAEDFINPRDAGGWISLLNILAQNRTDILAHIGLSAGGANVLRVRDSTITGTSAPYPNEEQVLGILGVSRDRSSAIAAALVANDFMELIYDASNVNAGLSDDGFHLKPVQETVVDLAKKTRPIMTDTIARWIRGERIDPSSINDLKTQWTAAQSAWESVFRDSTAERGAGGDKGDFDRGVTAASQYAVMTIDNLLAIGSLTPTNFWYHGSQYRKLLGAELVSRRMVENPSGFTKSQVFLRPARIGLNGLLDDLSSNRPIGSPSDSSGTRPTDLTFSAEDLKHHPFWWMAVNWRLLPKLRAQDYVNEIKQESFVVAQHLAGQMAITMSWTDAEMSGVLAARSIYDPSR